MSPLRGSQLLQEFARHMACDAKILDEDPDTGAKKYRYVRTGENHFSMAFAAPHPYPGRPMLLNSP